MIKANHSGPAHVIYDLLIPAMLKKNFDKFILLNEFPEIDPDRGLVVTPNHFSWWDGFFADYLMKRFTNRTPYILMLEKQLKKYFFFKYTGAFSVDPDSLSSVKQSVEYSKQILKSKSNYLIFYPQGEIQMYEKKFISLKGGLKMFLQGSDSDVLILSFKMFCDEKRKPGICCRIGKKFSPDEICSDFYRYTESFLENISRTNEDLFYKKGIDLFKL